MPCVSKNLEQIARRERQLLIDEVCDTSLFVLLMAALVKDPDQQLVISRLFHLN